MKVMHLLPTDKFSGAENVVCQIISMVKTRHPIDFVYCSKNGEIKEALEDRNIKYNLMKEFSFSEIKRVISEEKPDVIHAHDMRASLYAALCCKKIPLIAHIHNNSYESRKLTLKSILFLVAAKKAKHIFWVSESAYKGYKFNYLLKAKSSILYNIIDIAQSKNRLAEDEKEYNYDVIYLGRLSYEKNPEKMLKVFEIISQKRPETKMAIVGNGDLMNKVQESIRKNAFLKNVSCLGFVKNPYKILYDSKVMIMTSRWEGTPMCALEAMALGVPIVSTPTDGLADLVDDGKTGFLEFEELHLASKICTILNDMNLQQELSKNSEKRAKEIMNIDAYVKRLVDVYN